MAKMIARTAVTALLLVLLNVAPAAAFLIHPQGSVAVASKKISLSRHVSLRMPTIYITSSSSNQHFATKRDGGNRAVDGSRRGGYIFALVVAFCVWQFTIPPKFRRAHFCSSEACVQQRSSCSDCVTIQEWTSDIADYYRGGGGIQWDFSIDPKTLQANEKIIKETFGKR
jgi:hypothetical protein